MGLFKGLWRSNRNAEAVALLDLYNSDEQNALDWAIDQILQPRKETKMDNAPKCSEVVLPQRILDEMTRIAELPVTQYPTPGLVGPPQDCRVVQQGGGVWGVNLYYSGFVAGITFIEATNQLFTQVVVNQPLLKAILNVGSPASVQ